jgi:16S rRNA (adenine1518-N6/adenine1519-N6)-dimethyltransferase
VTHARESYRSPQAADRGGKLRPAGALAIAGVRPHKSKGQNFLVQPRVADRIVEAAEIADGDDVIEIGPGLGILSERIAERPVRRLILIELDERLAAQLTDRFAGDARVTVINKDFLSGEPRDFLSCAPDDFVTIESREIPCGPPLRVVANLPFNVAAAILERLCGMHTQIARMVLMFQREVAERIRARPGADNYGALSVYTAMYWEIGGHFRVAAGNFHPKPKVDAEVLTFAPRIPMPFAPEEERTVLATVRAAFSAPRKTLRNAVGRALAIESSSLEAAFTMASIDPAARVATLAVGDFVRLARALQLTPENGNNRDA